MSNSSLIAMRDDGSMDSPGPRVGGPSARRSCTAAQKLDHLAAYEVPAAEVRAAPICGPRGYIRRR